MSAFLSQGGYAFFVWSSYGMGLALLAAEVLVLHRERRTILQRLGRLARLRNLTPSAAPEAVTDRPAAPSQDGASRGVGGHL
jgi:heme exporter protein D